MDFSTAAQLNGSWPHYGRWCGSHNETLWNVARRPALFRLDIGGLYYLAPLLGFVGNELSKVGGRKSMHLTAQFRESRLDLGIGEPRIDCMVEPFDDLRRRVLGRTNAAPATSRLIQSDCRV